MTHKPASTLQEAIWMGNLGAPEEADIYMSLEGIDVCKGRVTDTRGRMAVMQ